MRCNKLYLLDIIIIILLSSIAICDDYAELSLDNGVRYLIETQEEDGSWKCDIPSTPGNTAINLLVLLECGEKGSSPRISRAVEWLLKNQRPDGGWAKTLNPEEASNIDITSTVMTSLLQTNVSANSPSMKSALKFIDSHGGLSTTSWSTKTLMAMYGLAPVASKDMPLPLEVILDPALFNQTVGYYHQFYYVPFGLINYELRYPESNRTSSQMFAIEAAIDWIKLHNSPDKCSLFTLALLRSGYPEESDLVQYGAYWISRTQREDGSWSGGRGTIRIFDTELAMISLSLAGMNKDHPALKEAKKWLFAQQYKDRGLGWWYKGSWSWSYWEIPDVDDTAYGIVALRSIGHDQGTEELKNAKEFLDFYQNEDGGWPTFAKNSSGVDGSLVDITSHVIEAYLALGEKNNSMAIQKASSWIESTQEDNGAWGTYWARNYTYGTYLGITGLHMAGMSRSSMHIDRGIKWLKDNQNADGGWGGIKGEKSTAEETSWALLALMEVGEDRASPEVQSGIKWLIDNQRAEGYWEPSFVFGDDTTRYIDPMLSNAFSVRALSLYTEA